MKSGVFTIRQLAPTTDTEKRLQKRQPSRVYVNEDVLLELTGSRDGGRIVYLEKAGKSTPSPDEPSVRREATLWKAPEKLSKDRVQLYKDFQEVCGYKIGGEVKITALGGTIPDAEHVVLEDITTNDVPQGQETAAAAPPTEPILDEDLPGWLLFLQGRLSLVEHVHAGLIFKNIFVRGPVRTFVVASVNGRPNGNARYLDRKTTVAIARPSDAKSEEYPKGNLEITGIRGMDAQIAKLNDLLRCFSANDRYRDLPNPNIVLHGGHGTGKTMLLDSIAKTDWGTVFRIQFKDKLSEIQDVFQRARLQQPSIVLIDQFERLVDKDRNNRNAVILAICEALDGLAVEARTKGVAPRVAVVAACLDYTTDMPEDLKEPDRFTEEIYLPLPDAAARREILTLLHLRVEPAQEPAILQQLSERTHAYNGKDLARLVTHARRLLCIRASKLSTTHEAEGGELDVDKLDLKELDLNGTNSQSQAEKLTPLPVCAPADYEEALKVVRPSAMHDINLKPPPIRWDDIGGQDSVKTSLRRAVRLSTESAETLARYFDRPPKGFLLYGPPGCSKTMAAQAMATESGLNFFAVKGAELLNMYVGESERAVRRLFQRAREVAPSMIFFDEIDSIAGQRHGFGHGSGGGAGSSSSSTSHGGLNVLTTLLNEMDGFEALQGVVVLAATNRPQALDPALLRPGRFDELIYVSPPDEEARKAIFHGVAAKRKMHADVDIDKLARDTDGYSGAEIKGICAVAGVAAYDRFIGHGLGTDAVEGEVAEGIAMSDLERAIHNQKRQITSDMIRGFEDWERQFRRH